MVLLRDEPKNAAATGKAFGLGPCHLMISFILATRPSDPVHLLKIFAMSGFLPSIASQMVPSSLW